MLRKMSLTGKVRDQRGFTLIEIIAVLVILAVLAVVAVPKYFDLVQDSKNKAAAGALAEAAARANQMAAKMLLTGGSLPSTLTIDSDFGDFTVSPLAITAAGVVVTATGKSTGNAAGGTATANIRIPSSN